MLRLPPFLAGVLFLVSTVATAQQSAPTALELAPAKFTLTGPRSQQQLVVTGAYGAAEPRDETAAAVLESSNPAVVRIEKGKAFPVADGTATVTAKIGDKNATAEVTVAQFGTPDPISFEFETLAALTKAGCNMGACHGSPSGKAGFRLSLRGYDPPLDMVTLRSETFGRRTNVMEPDTSLILKKGLMEVAHGGGRRLMKGDASHTVLRGWIAGGMPLDPETEPRLDRIEIYPKKRVFQETGKRQQVFVTGYFSDGTARDLTALTVFSSSAEAVAKVSEAGLVEKTGKGEAAILARYLDKMDTAEMSFLEPTPGFAWNNPPEFNFIDKLVNDKLQQLQILPSGLCSDDEFLRRAYLDVAGRLPTLEETQAFLNDITPEKRVRLVDQLLDSSDYASFWTMKLADVLRANSGKLTPTGVAKFNRWLYQSTLEDQPFDEFAKELLTARGNTFENPAANYWKSSRDPSDATESTVQLFLGIRIQCAKCHNHPFERWSQDNYYGIGAAFVRVGRKQSADKQEEIIFTSTGGEVTQPRTNKQMKVHLLLKGDVDVPADQDRRVVFADWLASADNPFFAKAAANRIWGHLLGRGIVDPVDDFRDSNPPSNAQLLDELSKQFAQNKFSRKWLIRTIMLSHTYQRSSRTNDFNKTDDIYFSHATTRMLTAEQLLDAICAVTAVPETFPNMPAGTRATELAEPPSDNYFLKIFGQPQREMVCECERSSDSNLSQALQMINGPTVHNKLRADNGRINQLIAAQKPDDEIISTLYMSGVCRTPTTDELKTAKAHIAASGEANRRQALEDIGWAILNSKEFLFQH
ncbi:DUF1549 and DUF1553 domain-containing protein [Planctomyces sp. SH-PL14]|uniref:DUF1549 and DUF1553 domain-containing protein n=1 Tax=Planctomyces sp. SH-PL14 TaxID=1632864 RepID=UPI00078DD6FC|nr:DUF1549 and DUF1553 domain-containing protein [Planctomyces sp. SH-PL14]AMV16833.1 Bacterial Ig-like domain (group 2) [Planctomyces sp. SH-PL14]